MPFEEINDSFKESDIPSNGPQMDLSHMFMLYSPLVLSYAMLTSI